ncbi:hypothetical protein, partial [Bacillus xiapuensis]|nr:hypothetical protein [Bacillus xiapuensis]
MAGEFGETTKTLPAGSVFCGLFLLSFKNSKHIIIRLFIREEKRMRFSNLNRKEIVSKLKAVKFD